MPRVSPLFFALDSKKRKISAKIRKSPINHRSMKIQNHGL
jgi:hypothetical protein